MSMSDSRLKTTLICLGISSGLCLAPDMLPAARAQSAFWDTAARRQSQDLSSAALNYLTNRADKKSHSFKFKTRSKGGVDKAIELLDRAVAADPTDPLPHYLLGIALAMSGRFEPALEALKKANKLDPDEEETLIAAGLAQHLGGNYRSAVSIWSKLEKRTENLTPVRVLLGYAYFRQGDFDQALDSFAAATEENPSCQAAYQGMAEIYLLSGDLVNARQYASRAESISTYPPVNLMLAEIDLIEGDEKSARSRLSAWKKSTRKGPVHRSMTTIGFSDQHNFQWDPLGHQRLDNDSLIQARNLPADKASRAAGLGKRGKADDLIATVKKGLAANPRDFFLVHELGCLQMAQGNPAAARASFKRALKLCSQCNLDLIYLASCSLMLQKEDEARSYMSRYRKIYPGATLRQELSDLTEAPQEAEAEAGALPGEDKGKRNGRGENKDKKEEPDGF